MTNEPIDPASRIEPPSRMDPASEIDAVVAAVPGVRDAYAARPVVARAVRAITDSGEGLAALTGSGLERHVTVNVGVAAEADSAPVALAIADAVREAAGLSGGAIPSVRVRISRLIPTPAP